MIACARWDDWSLAELVERKGAHRVSLVVPARNEEGTVGDVVTRTREALMETVALVDELVVIDSDSTDATYAVATDAGAAVHRSKDIRPDLGSHPGKGEAMWKSLFVTTGDLIVFMDADLLDWDTHFVPGLLGPLLTRPQVSLVKGFYERPGADGLQGGRVTELVARPWLALRHPELSGLVQPLAGEWAVRRSLFESLPVPTGYAVELAALVDTARLHGVETIAQVDLGLRSHDHQPLLDLGAMATQILAAMLAREPGLSAGEVAGEVALRQFRPGEAAIAAEARVVPTLERPPAQDFTHSFGTPAPRDATR
ncbi:Glucosyl-3-phosphoglycerate synthase [Nocardioides dokdonensis FR1436]|uniref:Glucosyl-3-phosphoglycerate synthase n=1 Tax=Nocardioides dokdonensis FR1436 TaxID=1300347 RepID=A0A1A9GKP1_9ACTN|nr:glucosyl-3-phosphoglycerate synthase [Nocardioides dokdonensis]ANH38222.1 Glucosyl-3-phosphoglycerate synthase [Nocardioides dokdonensis FR1436]